MTTNRKTYQVDVIQYYDSICTDIPTYRTYTTKRCDKIDDALDEVAKLKYMLFIGTDKLIETKRLNNTILSVVQKNFRKGIKHSIHIIEK